MTCSKWAGYTANNVSFCDHTAVGIVTCRIYRCILELFDALHPALQKKEDLGMRLLGEGTLSKEWGGGGGGGGGV